MKNKFLMKKIKLIIKTNKIRNLKFIQSSALSLLLVLLFSTVTRADDDSIKGADARPSYLGAMLGFNSADASSVNAATSLGATVGTKINSLIGLGLFGSYSGTKTSGPYLGLPSETDFSITVLTVQGNAYLGGFHAGAELGSMIRSWSGIRSTVTGGTSDTSMLIGINTGYDYKVSRALSVGAEIHYFIPFGSNQSKLIQGFAGVKIWI